MLSLPPRTRNLGGSRLDLENPGTPARSWKEPNSEKVGRISIKLDAEDSSETTHRHAGNADDSNDEEISNSTGSNEGSARAEGRSGLEEELGRLGFL
ncbi:hypothetical protein R1flu_017146 [Riccia fluitans]|uniref:Uncharacterized protein n=1 Tax=Riccia fluitans TaxID=41844 RepID=A0ABD1YP91_9MARC